MACILLIYMWVNDELSFDKFHENDNRLYQVMKNSQSANSPGTFQDTPGLLAKALVSEIPEIKYAVSVIPISFLNQKGILTNSERTFKASGLFVSEDYFNIFSYPLIHGNKNQVLLEKNAVVISEELAKKLFNTTENIIGKTIEWNQSGTSGQYIISGIFKNLPSNSSAQFDLLFNYKVFLQKKPNLNLWNNSYPSTYVLLKNNVNIDELNKKIAGFITTKLEGSHDILFLQKYSDRYLYGKYENGVPTGGRIAYVRLFSIIALIILVIACINFMNMSTAKASKRLKEVGVKKTVGAGKITLIFQYMGEAMLISFLSLIIAVMLVELLLPQFNMITGKQLGLTFNMNLLLSVLGITFFTGLIAGSYPAIYLSRFNPVTMLKGTINTSFGELLTRKGLVLFQFSISVILIVSVLVVYKQMEMIQTKNLGYNKDHIIYFEKSELADNNMNNVRDKYEQHLDNFLLSIKNIRGVVNAANFCQLISKEHGSTTGIYWEGKNPDNQTPFANINVGYDFIETLGIELKEGRTFSRKFGAEKSTIIFNETAIKKMGLKNPIGKIVNLWGEDKQIIGVTKDFHFESLYESCDKPLLFNFSMDQLASKIMVKLRSGMEQTTIERLEKYYKEHNHNLPFEFKFLDDEYQTLYASEMRVAVLSRYFAGIAILISCLGLFGLVSFTTNQRTYEIGVRKSMGATYYQIIFLLLKEILVLIFIAILFAWTTAYIFSKFWLKEFYTRITLTPNYFFEAALFVIVLSVIVVFYQCFVAAREEPSTALKTE